jgi:hypothetical protein
MLQRNTNTPELADGTNTPPGSVANMEAVWWWRCGGSEVSKGSSGRVIVVTKRASQSWHVTAWHG